MQSTETWRTISGHEGRYEVSDHGRVKSLSRTVVQRKGNTYTLRERILKSPPTKAGYPVVNLYDDRGPRTWYVHRLVADAFIGPRPDGMEICHINGDPADPRVANLRYDTSSANDMDKVRHGTHRRGERMHSVVLTEEIVRDVRRRKSSGESSVYAMAREYGVNYGTLKSAVTGQSWSWLT